MDWKEILKDLKPETLVRPDEEDRTRSMNQQWVAPVEMVRPEVKVETTTKEGCPECEYITDGSMEDRRLAKENPDTPGKCKECATHWCEIDHNDHLSDSGKCGFRVCDKHWKIMTKNGKIEGTTPSGGHKFGSSVDDGNYPDDRDKSDYDGHKFNEDRHKKRLAREKKKKRGDQ
tara:strand:+ start:4788 stop:5309 length:522 start_codon:yes stop_codon:yes gene_type:complete